MALENEILVGRFNRLLQRLLSMKGPVPSPQLAGDVAPGIELEVDRPEWGWLKGEVPVGAGVAVGANAANNSRVRIRLTTPNTLFVITRILAASSTAQQLQLYIGGASYNADLVNPQTIFYRDSRPALKPGGNWNTTGKWGGGSLSTTNADTATAGSLYTASYSAVGTPVELLKSPLILITSDIVNFPLGVDVRAITVNTDLYVSFEGYARPAEESELTGIGS